MVSAIFIQVFQKAIKAIWKHFNNCRIYRLGIWVFIKVFIKVYKSSFQLLCLFRFFTTKVGGKGKDRKLKIGTVLENLGYN